MYKTWQRKLTFQHSNHFSDIAHKFNLFVIFLLFISKILLILLLCSNLVVVRMKELAILYVTSKGEDNATEIELLHLKIYTNVV